MSAVPWPGLLWAACLLITHGVLPCTGGIQCAVCGMSCCTKPAAAAESQHILPAPSCLAVCFCIHAVGEATATFSNVILVCLPNPNSEAGLGPSAGPGSGPGPVSGSGSGPGSNLSSPGSGPAGSNSSEPRSTPSGRASEIVPAPNPSGSGSSPSGPGFNFSGPASNPSGPASESGPGSNSGGPGSSPSPRP